MLSSNSIWSHSRQDCIKIVGSCMPMMLQPQSSWQLLFFFKFSGNNQKPTSMMSRSVWLSDSLAECVSPCYLRLLQSVVRLSWLLFQYIHKYSLHLFSAQLNSVVYKLVTDAVCHSWCAGDACCNTSLGLCWSKTGKLEVLCLSCCLCLSNTTWCIFTHCTCCCVLVHCTYCCMTKWCENGSHHWACIVAALGMFQIFLRDERAG